MTFCRTVSASSLPDLPLCWVFSFSSHGPCLPHPSFLPPFYIRCSFFPPSCKPLTHKHTKETTLLAHRRRKEKEEERGKRTVRGRDGEGGSRRRKKRRRLLNSLSLLLDPPRPSLCCNMTRLKGFFVSPCSLRLPLLDRQKEGRRKRKQTRKREGPFIWVLARFLLVVFPPFYSHSASYFQHTKKKTFLLFSESICGDFFHGSLVFFFLSSLSQRPTCSNSKGRLGRATFLLFLLSVFIVHPVGLAATVALHCLRGVSFRPMRRDTAGRVAHLRPCARIPEKWGFLGPIQRRRVSGVT